VYARYGGRDAEGPDTRQSLEGLDYTMASVLRTHEGREKEYAPRSTEGPKFIREVAGSRRGGRCMHCHQVKEALNDDLRKSGKWTRDMAWRYPLPENVGLELEVDRGNVVKRVKERSPASVSGLAAGDVLRRLGGVPIHSFADAQFALDRAPKSGTVEVVWRRGDKERTAKLTLADGWRKTDIGWRPSLQRLVPSARLYGDDLTADEKKALGLSARQLAFRQQARVSTPAQAAGVRAGDVILGVDGRPFETDAGGFVRYVQSNYLIGDKVTLNVLRDGKRLDLPMTLGR
jgi:S1-C subfamily serine protease